MVELCSLLHILWLKGLYFLPCELEQLKQNTWGTNSSYPSSPPLPHPSVTPPLGNPLLPGLSSLSPKSQLWSCHTLAHVR